MSKKPLVFIDVNLGKDKGKQKLTIYHGDSPSAKAKEFGETHSKHFICINEIIELADNKVKVLE
jgi:hypothetical protein